MKILRVVLYLIMLIALFFVPLQRVNIADLKPVEAVWMYMEEGDVVLCTDTGDVGIGNTVEKALADMKQNSLGIIYLDTAQYLLVAEEAQKKIADIQPYINDTVRVCKWGGEGDFVDAVKYMDIHNVGVKLKRLLLDGKMPELLL